MPFAQFAGAPKSKVSSMEDYSNNFLFFYSRDYTVQLHQIKDFTPQNFFKKVKRKISLSKKIDQTQYEPISERGGDTARTEVGARSSFKAILKQVQQTSRQFYLSVSECRTNELILMLMHHFSSFQEMNEHLGRKRFMAALAAHISSEEESQFMFLFESVQIELLQEASKGLLTLKPFYSLAGLKLGDVKIDALNEVNELQLANQSMEAFVQKIPRNKDNLTFGLQIYRSAFKVPPSNHPSTHRMSTLLYETKDLEAFEAPLLQIFIRERWKGARNFFYFNAILLIISLILLFFHSAFYRDWLILVPLALIQIWMLLVEVLEMMDKKCGYFMEFWNWFDLSRIILTFIYCGLVAIGSVDQEIQSDFLTMLNLFQTLRTFYIFFIFQSLRVLLRIVIEIIKDMSAFLVFVTLSTLLLGMLFTSCIRQDDLTDQTYQKLLYQAFLLNFGYFDLKLNTGIFRFIFMFGMLLIPLIMMNMLIAIMGDTYGRVREEQSRRDFQELIGLVEKYEVAAKVLCKFKRKKDWTFIFYSKQKLKDGVESLDEWQGQIKGIKRHIDKIQTKNQQWQDTADQEFRERQDWEKRTEEWQRKVDKQQRKIEAWQRRAEIAQKKTEKSMNEILELLRGKRESSVPRAPR